MCDLQTAVFSAPTFSKSVDPEADALANSHAEAETLFPLVGRLRASQGPHVRDLESLRAVHVWCMSREAIIIIIIIIYLLGAVPSRGKYIERERENKYI